MTFLGGQNTLTPPIYFRGQKPPILKTCTQILNNSQTPTYITSYKQYNNNKTTTQKCHGPR